MIVKAGQTKVITHWVLEDYVTGEPVTGLTITDMSKSYVRDQEAGAALDALVAHGAVTDAWADGEAIEISSTNNPGVYRVDFPDAAFATGKQHVQLNIKDTGTPRTFRHAVMEVTLEAWSAAIEDIAATGVALNQTAESATVTTGTETNTYAKTIAHDADYHQVAAVGAAGAGIIDYYYQFDIGPGAVPFALTISGRLHENSPPSGGDLVDIYVYDWGNTTFEHISPPSGDFIGIANSTSADDETKNNVLFSRHVGTGVNEGLVRIRLEGNTLEDTGTELFVDFVYIEYAKVGVDVIQISGDSDAADNLEAMLDGTGGVVLTANLVGDVTGNVDGSVSDVANDVLGDVAGNVDGSVANVTGDVGGNVDGNVGGTINGFTTAAKAEIESEVNDALVVLDLDHLIQVNPGAEEPTDGSYLDQIMHKDAGQTFDATTDSLEAQAEAAALITAPLIADAVWDELLAGHTTNDSAGEILTKAGLGSGGTAFQIKVVSSVSGNPEQGATVELFLDADRNDLYTGGETDGNGEITFSLVSGTTYYYRVMENDHTTTYGSFTV